MATHPEAIIRYRASVMVLKVHSDALYLSAPVATSSLAVFLEIVCQFESMAPYISPVQSSNWLQPLLLKLNSVPSSSMPKKPRCYGLSLKNVAPHNHKLQYTSTTPQLLALLITPSNNSIHKPWKCDISGYLMVNLNDSSDSTINRDKRNWVTTLPNIILPAFTNMFTHIMFTWTTLQHSSSSSNA